MIESLVCPKRYYHYYFSKKLVNELQYWMEKHPHVIKYHNVADTKFVKVNGTLLKKEKHLIQISVCELYNDLILPVFQGKFHIARNYNGILCIEDISIRGYIPK